MASTRLYSEALERFQQNVLARHKESDTLVLGQFLLDGSRSTFATPDSAKKAASQLATDVSQKYSAIKIGKTEVVPKKWIDNILGNIDSIVDVGGFLTKNAPESVGMAWFAISLTLKAISNNYNLYALFGQGLTDITEVMIIVVHYDRLYDERHKPEFKASDLVDKLFRDTVAAYVAVLDFAFAVKKHMSGGSFDKIKHAFKDFFNTQAPKFQAKLSHIAEVKAKILESSQGAFQDKTLQQFGSVQVALTQIQQNQSQGLELQLEQRQMLAAMRDEFRQMKDFMRRKTPWEELKDEFMINKERLSPLLASQPIMDRLLAKKHENTGTWIFEKKSYQMWATSERSTTLCIVGGSGSGKSIVLASIARQLEIDTKSEALFLNYVSCVGNDDSQVADLGATKLSRVFNTLLYQIYELAAQDDGKMSLLENCNRIFRNPKKDKADQSAARLLQDDTLPDFVGAMERLVITLQRDTTLIIDAVGTLGDDDQAELYNNLQKLTNNTSRPHRIAVLIGSHANSKFVQLTSGMNTSINLSQDNNNRKDMEIVLNSYLRNLSGWSENEKRQAKDMVLSKAGSNFGYIEDVAIPFLQQPFQRPITAHLPKLPESMNEGFNQSLLSMAPNYFELLRLAVTWCLLSPRTITVKEIAEVYSGIYTTNEFNEEANVDIDDDSYNPKATSLEIQQISAASGPFLMTERRKDGQTLVKLQDARQVKNFCLQTKAPVIPQNHSNHVCDVCKSTMGAESSLNIEPKIAHYEIALVSLKHLNSPLFQRRFGLLQDLDKEDLVDRFLEHEKIDGVEVFQKQNPEMEDCTEGDGTGEEVVQNNEPTDSTATEAMPDDTATYETQNEEDDVPYYESSVDEDSEDEDTSNASLAYAEEFYSTIYTRKSTLRCEIMDWPYHLREAERLWPIEERRNDPSWLALNKLIQQELHKFASNQVVCINWQKLWQLARIRENDILKVPICLAASLGLATWVESLLDAGADVNQTSGHRNVAQTSGELVTVHENVDLLRLLLRRGADFYRAQPNDAPALHIWLDLYGSKRSVVEAFVDYQIDFGIRNQHGFTGLHMFAWVSSDIKSFDLIMNRLSKRPDINAEDNFGETPLHKLLWRRDIPLNMLKAFLAVEGIDVNHDDYDSQQPLGLASQWGSLEVLKLLIAAKADLHDVDSWQRTALHKAAAGGHVECIKTLLDAGLALEAMSSGNYTPLQHAAWKGQLSAVQFLVAQGSDINCSDFHNRSPLFNAILGGKNEQGTARFLLHELKKANCPASQINRVTKGGRTPLRQAAYRGFADVVRDLLEYVFGMDDADCKASINKGDTALQQTPLHCAAARGHSKCVELLVRYGADTRLKDKKGKTALVAAQEMWAQRNEKAFEEVVIHLINADHEAAISEAELPSIAAANGSIQVLRRLYDLQADLNRTDSLGWTPVAHAKYSGHKAAEHFLKYEISWGGTLPSKWDAVTVVDDTGLQITWNGNNKHRICVVSNKPLPSGIERFYYEVTINNLEKSHVLAVGFCTLGAEPHVFPGWLPKGKASFALSWAYHGDDGCLYHMSPSFDPVQTGEVFRAGDTIGCGVDLELRTVWFTKNGRKLAQTFDDVKGRLFPILGLRSPVSIRTNFGREPFLWKDEQLVNGTDSLQLNSKDRH